MACPEVAFEYPTIAELARHLAGEPKRIPTVQDGPAVLKTAVQLDGRAAACARRGAAERRRVPLDRGGEEASLTFSELERRAGCGPAGGPRSVRRARAPDVPARA